MIRVAITTYNRPAMVKRLVKALAAPGVDIHVYDDGSKRPVKLRDATVYRYEENAGKDFWYLRIKDLMRDAFSDPTWQFMFWMPDDVMPLREDLIEHLTSEMIRLKSLDRNATCINPLKLRYHPLAQWVPFEVVERHGYYQTQWMDCCGFVDRRFVMVAKDAVAAVIPFYHDLMLSMHDGRGIRKGTGVGKMISVWLHNLGYNLYQSKETLLSHGGHRSALSPDKDTSTVVTP